MAHLTVYRQKRFDEGVRSGIELDDRPIAEQFEDGGGDMTCRQCGSSTSSPLAPAYLRTSGAAEQWLLDHSPIIREALTRYAKKPCRGGLQW